MLLALALLVVADQLVRLLAVADLPDTLVDVVLGPEPAQDDLGLHFHASVTLPLQRIGHVGERPSRLPIAGAGEVSRCLQALDDLRASQSRIAGVQGFQDMAQHPVRSLHRRELLPANGLVGIRPAEGSTLLPQLPEPERLVLAIDGVWVRDDVLFECSHPAQIAQNAKPIELVPGWGIVPISVGPLALAELLQQL